MSIKILVISDDGVSSGYGRISAEVNKRLVKRGYQVMALSLAYDGILPASYDSEPLPYHVGSLQGKPNWPDVVLAVMNVYVPDVVAVIQDAPYSQTVRNAPVDWSKFGFVMTAPVDGKPIYPAWVETAKQADALLTISEFGVQAWKEAGVQAGLCRPGINPDKFYVLPADKRAEIRAKLGVAPDAFVLGVMAMNQGRKSISQMCKAFFDFVQDKPDARLLLDMDEVSPAGFDIPSLCREFNWDVSKLIFRSQCVRAGVFELRERYNILDAHAVLAFREGFGLPIVEAMACGVVSIAQDWCAGTEVLKDGRGILIPSIDYFMPSTWGGALDMLPDYHVMTEKLQWLFDNPAERAAMAKRGMEWARAQSWDTATDAAVVAIEKALAKKKIAQLVTVPQTVTPVIQPPPTSPDGVAKSVELLETVV